jgi:opacity protein-like surface antigen
MKATAFVLGVALACAAAAHAADVRDNGTSTYGGSSHHATMQLRDAMHRIGSATRHAWHRIDASLHRMGHHDRTTAS